MGVSFTYLASPIYKSLTQLYLRNNKDQRMDKNENIMYEFCFHIRNDQSLQQLNVIVLNFIGGYNFSVVHPIVVLGEKIEHADGYCLGVLENTDLEHGGLGARQQGIATTHAHIDPKVAKLLRFLCSQEVYRDGC